MMAEGGHVRLFVSCVSDEFADYRDQLRRDLTRHNVEVKVQEELVDTGDPTLQKLDLYISHCDAVIHLVGDMAGAPAHPDSVQALRAAHPDLNERLPALGSSLDEGTNVSYTQWEAWLALYHRRRLLIARAEADAPRGPAFAATDASRAAQAAHLERLAASHRHPGATFASADALAKHVLRSVVFDLLRQPERKPNTLPYAPLGSLFKGREGFMDRLQAILGDPTATRAAAVTGKALHGLGGVGKTRLAVEYGHRHAADYTALLFLSAETPQQLNADLAGLVGPLVLDLPEKDAREDEARIAAALRWLNANPGWFLILDNVDTPEAAEVAEALLAKLSGGHALITGRLANYGAGVETLELDVLTAEDAAAFLLERTQGKRVVAADDEARSREIAEELGQLALALEQAGAYVARHRIGFGRYLALWREQREKVLEWFDERLMRYPRSVAVTWATSVEQLSPESRRLLDRLAWLAPEPIPESLLDVAIPAPEGEAEAFRPFDAHEALAGLLDHSLATPAADGDGAGAGTHGISFVIHRLVQEVTRRRQAEAQPPALAEAVDWMRAAFGGDSPWDVRTWPRLEPLAPHAMAVIAPADEATVNAAATSSLMDRLATLSLAKASYAEAEPLFRRALAINEASYGLEHPFLATNLNSLAILLGDTNRAVEAEPLFRRALAIREASYGSEHPDVATSLNTLACLLADINRAAEAEPLYRRALAIREASYGPEHPDVATCLNNLAGLFADNNRAAEAEPLYRRALAIWEASYGPEHPRVAASLNNLARLLADTNRAAEAEPLYRRALAIWEASYGPEHPRVATSLDTLAILLADTNRAVEAEPLFRRALAIREASYGSEHPDVATSLNSLAAMLADTNRAAEAEPLYMRALAIREASYGPEHPDVANGLNNLAGLFADTNRAAEAVPLYRRALAIWEASYGPEHPHVANSLNNLATLFADINRAAEAEPLFRRALTIREASYGPEHPGVANSLNNLAILLANTNRAAEAEPLYWRALAICETSYGPEHPHVATSLNNLAFLLAGTNRAAEAEPMYRRALAIREVSYGPEHPDLANSLNNLATLLAKTNRAAEAEPLYRRALAIREASYGPEHPNVARFLDNLALVVGDTGRVDEADRLFHRAAIICLKSLGRDHPWTERIVSRREALLRTAGRSDGEIAAAMAKAEREAAATAPPAETANTP